MSASKDSVSRTFIVAFILCVVCSVVVSTAAVMLKPSQELNREMDRKRNILSVASINTDGSDAAVEKAFQDIDTRMIDLETGTFTDAIAPADFSIKKAAMSDDLSVALTGTEDIASIRRLPKYQEVYLVNNDKGELKTLVMPVYGYGLWSTMYAYVALDANLNTIEGITFYEQAETPGLGGEVANPAWTALWDGKQITDQVGDAPKIEVIKGKVDQATPNAEYKVDGLSGATLTSNGVSNLMQFWFGELGYQKFLENLKQGEA